MKKKTKKDRYFIVTMVGSANGHNFKRLTTTIVKHGRFINSKKFTHSEGLKCGAEAIMITSILEISKSDYNDFVDGLEE